MTTDIVILHFGRLEKTKKCISSLLNEKDKFRNIILVNNDPMVKLETSFKNKKVKTVNSKENTGFAKGVNKGVKKALHNNADTVILLNNDTKLMNGTLSNLKKSISNTKGIVGPIIQFKSNANTLYDHGGYISKLTGKTYHDNKIKISEKKVIEPDYISGCCMAISSKVFKKVGFFDKRFFMYYEDVDFCLRAKSKGFKVKINTDSAIMHFMQNNKKNQTQIYLIQSCKKFYKKYSQNFLLGFTQPIIKTFIFSVKDLKNSVKYIQTLIS